jgi:O-antigen/teichoic acid export membrane protein
MNMRNTFYSWCFVAPYAIQSIALRQSITFIRKTIMISFIQVAQRFKYCNLILTNLLPIIKNFFVYAGSALMLRSITIITAPITMSMVAPTEYALLALLNSFISVACILCGYGLRQALSVEYFHSEPAARNRLINDAIATYVVFALPLLIGSVLLHAWINHYFFMNMLPTYVILSSLGIIFIYFFVELTYQLLQYEGKAWMLTLLQTTVALITITTNLFLLCYAQLGISSMIIGQLLGMLYLGTVSVYYRYLIPNMSLTIPSWQSLKRYLKSGLPFIPGMVCAWLLAAGDRWVLVRYATLHDVGIYSVADTFGQLFQMIILLPFSSAYLPALMKKFARHAHAAQDLMQVEYENRTIMWCVAIGSLFIGVSAYCVSKPLCYWLLPKPYQEAIPHIGLLLVGYIFLLASYFPAALIQFHKKSYFLALALCGPAILNVLLNMALVPVWGITGCVLATVVSYGLYWAVMLIYNHYLVKKMNFSYAAQTSLLDASR